MMRWIRTEPRSVESRKRESGVSHRGYSGGRAESERSYRCLQSCAAVVLPNVDLINSSV